MDFRLLAVIILRNTHNMSMNVAKRQQGIATGVKLHRANF